MHKRVLTTVVALVMTLLAIGSRGWASPGLQARATITYPTDGMTVSGVVEIQGAATHPNILWYNMSYAAGAVATGGSQWVALAEVENTPIEGGTLAVWDTTTVPNGSYTLALTVRGANDENYYQHIVTNLTVNNTQPVEAPVSEPPTPIPESVPTVVPASPTPVTIQQPPTLTPPPAPTSEGGTVEGTLTPAGEDEGFSFPGVFGQLWDAFIAGGKVTFLLFTLWALFFLAKVAARRFLRQQAIGEPFWKK